MPSVFTLGKEPFALGKGFAECSTRQSPLGKIFSTKGLCRVLFIRALGKIKKKICRVLGAALGKIFSAVAAPAVNGYFAECPTQHSAKKNYFFKNLLCRVPQPRHSAKFFFIFFKKYFAECPCPDTRQSFFYFF